ncbi:phospho-2-dehydro-3-deoxyheptonate aldolase 1, chloroplastic-like [Coffea arabica]|uniref:Phospho-2-dehydro-3-deoxyheptonate aldolase n=1 Tax=Coffea arabica TaxID=13443 RepID=A0ABM4UFF6_COFAR
MIFILFPGWLSSATLNLLRAFATGGYAAMHRITRWNLDFTEHNEQGDRYRELAHHVDEALGFMAAVGLTIGHPIVMTTEFWTSHECLLLPYEQSVTRLDSISGLYYDCSAHFLWVGERTWRLDGAHVEFLRGVANPLGIKPNLNNSFKQILFSMADNTGRETNNSTSDASASGTIVK